VTTMRSRIAKELRALILPWSAALIAAFLLPILILMHEGALHWGHDFWGFLAGCATIMACASVPLLAALSFGTEYQQRTLPLLLAQPLERHRLWNEKLLAVVVTIISPLLLFALSLAAIVLFWSGWKVQVKHDAEVLQMALFVCTLMLTTVCSTGFWTMIARSTIGGIAFSLAAQFIVGAGVVFTLQKHYDGLPLSDSIITGAVVVTGLLYSIFFLWLGRRKFVGLEMREHFPGEGFSSATLGVRWRPALLRCRPEGAFLNLVRKELRLQKTVFVISGLLLICWAVTLLLSLAVSVRKDYLEGIFGGLIAIYIFLVPVLAATISLGEERSLGLSAWHLTLPVSARAQWLIKLLVSALVAVGFGFLVPAALLELTATLSKVEPFKFGPNFTEFSALVAAIGLPFFLGFWAVTFLGNTVRAVVATVIGVGAIGSLSGFGVSCGPLLGGILFWPITAAIAWLQLPVYTFDERDWVIPLAWISGAIVVTALLGHSMIQFRRSQARAWTMAKHALILAALVLGCFAFTTSIVGLAKEMQQSIDADLGYALNHLPFKESDFATQNERVMTVEDLDRSNSMSWTTRFWLRKARIRITVSFSDETGQQQRGFQALIIFPNGRGFGAASDLFPSNKLQN
jgi:hypothetical protein